MTQWEISLNKKPIKRFTMKNGWNLTIGRGTEADVIVDNTAISRKHASLELKDGEYILSDLGSLNGTFVNGKQISGSETINPEDSIKLGKFVLSVAEDWERLEVSSYGAHPDTDDKTVIVSAKQLMGESKASSSNKKESNLVLIEGHATPLKLSLKGKNSIKIGKSISCDMILKGLFVAQAQFYIVSDNSNYKIIPQKSWANTFVNGEKITKERTLVHGDIIKVCSNKMQFC